MTVQTHNDDIDRRQIQHGAQSRPVEPGKDTAHAVPQTENEPLTIAQVRGNALRGANV